MPPTRAMRTSHKSGCRELFAAAGVPHPIGVEHIDGLESAIDAIAGLRARKPELAELVMKLNEGVSGEGNAIVDVRELPARVRPASAPRSPRASRAWPSRPSRSPSSSISSASARAAASSRSGSSATGAQPQRTTRDLHHGDVEIVSTHDQLLGGASGQSYLGCRFPAAPDYAPQIAELARRVGRRLARAGVVGRSAIDFGVVRRDTVAPGSRTRSS